MHGVTVPFFELLTVGLILRALKRQRLLDYTLAGLSMGIGLCFYFSFRLFPLVIGLFFLALWSVRHDFVRSSWRGLILIGLGVIIASVPVTQFAIQNPEAFLEPHAGHLHIRRQNFTRSLDFHRRRQPASIY